MKEQILFEYNNQKLIYEQFGLKLKRLIEELIQEQKISVHQISARVKDSQSLNKKIDRKKGKYKHISDITDICGIRVITYLESDVDSIASIIEQEFEIDKDNSIDKRKLDLNQFGYKSLHYVLSLNSTRAELTENKKYSNIKLEIQIRSILQHAWAEIEHDLGYKGEITIPDELKRSFNRLAALLETADIEFDRLKNEILKYEQTVSKKIEEKPERVKLNKASLRSFLNTNPVLNEAKEIIVKNSSCVFSEADDFYNELEKFPLFDILTVSDFEQSLESKKTNYLKFVNNFTENMEEKILYDSLPIFYYQHFLASQSRDENFINKYFNYGGTTLGGEKSAKDFIKIYDDSLKN